MISTNKQSSSSPFSAIIFGGVMAVVTIFACELMIRISTIFSPNIRDKVFIYEDRFIEDIDLSYRGNPRHHEFDQRGFRNQSALDNAEIVAIGDSHTFGTWVSSDAVWTSLLSKRLGVNVYSMALGGYGPVQYEILVREAAALSPKIVLIGIYLGNDFFNSWSMYSENALRYPAPKELLSVARAQQPIPVTMLFTPGSVRSEAPEWDLRTFLSRHSALYGFARALKNQFAQNSVFSPSFDASVAALTPKQVEYSSIFEGEQWRTILTARYRHLSMNIHDPRVIVGRWMTMRAAELIFEQGRENGFETVFLFLPTKESVFAPQVINLSEHQYFSRLIEDEANHKAVLKSHLQEIGANYIDLLPALQRSIEQPYFENADGHPNTVGHNVIENELARELRTLIASRIQPHSTQKK